MCGDYSIKARRTAINATVATEERKGLGVHSEHDEYPKFIG